MVLFMILSKLNISCFIYIYCSESFKIFRLDDIVINYTPWKLTVTKIQIFKLLILLNHILNYLK